MGKQFGGVLRKLRERRKLKLRQAAMYMGISNSYLSQIESGEREPPQPKHLENIAKVYRVPVTKITEAMKMELDDKIVKKSETSASKKAALLACYDILSPQNKQFVSDFIMFLLDRQEEKIENRRSI